ncbi:BLOC-1-related complex subunit 6 [Engystomops pustulosus]|uniref:BLOC-1-related complex subunit 6 n=1 Tax=Engystomops pustulosus TaxID=76066 RepID=UPI003AFA48F0
MSPWRPRRYNVTSRKIPFSSGSSPYPRPIDVCAYDWSGGRGERLLAGGACSDWPISSRSIVRKRRLRSRDVKRRPPGAPGMEGGKSNKAESDSGLRHHALQRSKADIPPIDPEVLHDLEILTQDVALKVDQMMKSLSGTIQNMTALSVGYIQTYRDSVDSLGEAVDMSIKGMYTLMARCEELDRSMQPIHALAKQIREIKRTLEMFEALCK